LIGVSSTKNYGLNALLAPYVCRRGNFGPLTKTMQF